MEKQRTIVLFDWYSTLCQIIGTGSRCARLERQFQHVGLNYSLEQIEAAMRARERSIEQRKLRGERRPQKPTAIVSSYRQILFLLGHDDTSRDLARRVYDAFSSLEVDMYPDALSTIQTLSEKGITIGIISNTSPSTRQVIESHVCSWIRPRCIIISGEIGIHKPAQTIFRLAAARLRTTPDHCIYVGDNLQVDAIGSVQKGGYKTGLWIDRDQAEPERAFPNRVAHITSLSEVIGFVD